MKFNKNVLKEKWAAYTVAACSAVLLYMLLTHLGTLGRIVKGILKICAPVILALIMAYILDPLVATYSKYVLNKVKTPRLRHSLSVLLSVLTVILFIAVLMVALVPQIIDSIVLFARNVNGYVRSMQRLMMQLSNFAARHDIDLSKFISSSDELLQSITRILPENVNKIVNASFGFGRNVFEWIISFILAIYLMLDNHKLKKGFVRLLKAVMPDHVYHSSATFWNRCNSILVEYIAFDILDGLIIGILNWIFMLIMDMPYVAIISVIVGVTNLAPTFGPMVGAAIGAFILVLVNPWHALWFLLFTVVLQTFDGYILKPRLFGERLGVSAVWILISLIIGGRFLGVAGILLAIPFAAIGDFIYHDYIIKRLEKRKKEMEDHELAEMAAGIQSGDKAAPAKRTGKAAAVQAAGQTNSEENAADPTGSSSADELITKKDAANPTAGEAGAGIADTADTAGGKNADGADTATGEDADAADSDARTDAEDSDDGVDAGSSTTESVIKFPADLKLFEKKNAGSEERPAVEEMAVAMRMPGEGTVGAEIDGAGATAEEMPVGNALDGDGHKTGKSFSGGLIDRKC